MELVPADTQSAMEYAFLCNETKRVAEARRIFDRIRKTGNPVAETAFRNIDRPLAQGIERWQRAIALGADNFSAHFELATLAEQRDELPLAAVHYEKAWRILPDRRSVLVDLGRVWQAQGRTGEATAALLAASRGGEPRAAEMAREHEAWIVDLLSGLGKREHQDLLALLAKVKQHALATTDAKLDEQSTQA